MTTEPDERRRYQIPSTPGNYPEDFISKVKEALYHIRHDPEHLSALQQRIHEPAELHGTVLAADIRNFTKTFEENSSRRIQSFLNEFFRASSDVIYETDARGAFVNKLLGDGLFAHLPTADPGHVVDAARQMIQHFNRVKKAFEFKYANLSIAITKADYLMATIGGERYLDYTLLGPKINSLFRMLSRTEGAMIWVSGEVKDQIVGTHCLVYIGDLKFKGIVPRVSCYSVIRRKSEREVETGKEDECVGECDNYQVCRNAWQQGRSRTIVDENEFAFDLDCNVCGQFRSLCWSWNSCLPKFKNAQNQQATICCSICRNYRNCFHNFQLGRQAKDMISCDKSVYQTCL